MFWSRRLGATAVLVLVAVQAAFGQTVALRSSGTSGTITASGQFVTLTNVGGLATLGIQTVGTVAGLTWELQCSDDGTTFDTDDEVPVTLVSSTPAAADAITSNAEALYTASIAGCSAVRIASTAYTSGSLVFTLTAITSGGGSSGGGSASSVSIAQGGNTAAVNASSQLSVTCANCSGSGVSVNEDVASADGQAGTPAYTVRNSTLTGATSLDGDYQPMKSTNAGATYVTETYADVIASTGVGASGAQTQRVVTATDSTIGTVTAVTNLATIGTSVTPGTAAANLGKAEDAAHTTGDTLVGIGCVRESTSVDLSANTSNLDYEPCQVDAAGRLWTNPFPASPAAATYIPVRLSDGASFLTPSTDSTHGSAIGSTGPAVMGEATTALSSDTAVSDGQSTRLKADTLGRLITTPGCGTNDRVRGYLANTDGASTSVLAAQGAGIIAEIWTVIIVNSGAVDVTVDLRDGTAGSVLTTLMAPATTDTGGGGVYNLNSPILFTANTAVAADASAAATTLYITVLGCKVK